ncbi:hypothetical protein BJY24_002965 [Nocardia transvalensis]|uniref:DUF8020 domain-containing protein n=1 Tax=Nocardia transvalensis TaxID=37333 RepID=A0A7W9PEA8_9NOCA|nr:hypothetical protein [Nocardia transvalensis]MBB5914098.1 hypothetical protein [Nocardia transvalensis]
MTIRSGVVAALTVIGALAVGFGTAHAAPAPDRQIGYSAAVAGETVTTELTGGTFELVDSPGATPDAPRTLVDIKDSAGVVALEFPLDFRAGGLPVPVRPVLRDGGRVLELIVEKAAGAPVAPVASPIENDRAINDFTSKLGVAAAIGGLIGAVVGGAVGCVVGIFFLCVPGVVVGGVIGGALGAIAGGGPSVVANWVELMNTLQAPDGTTPWADRQDG